MRPNVHDKSSIVATYRVPTVDNEPVQVIDKILTSVEQSTLRETTIEQSTQRQISVKQSTQRLTSSSPTEMGTSSQTTVTTSSPSTREDELLTTVHITTDHPSIEVTQAEPSSTLTGYDRLKDLDPRQSNGLSKFVPVVFLLLLLLVLLLKGTTGNFFYEGPNMCRTIH